MSATPARHLGTCFLGATAYVAMTWASVWLLKHPLIAASDGLRLVVGLAPLLPMAWATRAAVRLVLAGDELQRRIDLEAIALAALLVGLGCLTLSWMLVAGVVAFSARAAMLWVFPALWVVYVFARIWAARRYR